MQRHLCYVYGFSQLSSGEYFPTEIQDERNKKPPAVRVEYFFHQPWQLQAVEINPGARSVLCVFPCDFRLNQLRDFLLAHVQRDGELPVDQNVQTL